MQFTNLPSKTLVRFQKFQSGFQNSIYFKTWDNLCFPSPSSAEFDENKLWLSTALWVFGWLIYSFTIELFSILSHRPFRIPSIFCPPSFWFQQHPPASLRHGKELLQPVLDEATKARQKSIQLQGMQFADELASQLLKHGTLMENLYTELKNNLSLDPPDEDKVSHTMGKIQLKQKWYEKAEAGSLTSKRFWGKSISRLFFPCVENSTNFQKGGVDAIQQPLLMIITLVHEKNQTCC